MKTDANIPLTSGLPQPQLIVQRIVDCREELAALRKLLRASKAAYKAEESYQRRQQEEAGRER